MKGDASMIYLIKPLHNKKGVALISVMLVFLVMVTMLGGISVYSTSHLRGSSVTTQSAASFYAAEAGINVETENFTAIINQAVSQSETMAQLLSDIDEYIALNLNKSILLNNNHNQASQAIVSIQNLGEINSMLTYRITSHGHVGGQVRTTSKDIMFRYIPGSPDQGNGFVIDKSILTRGNINAAGLTVTGNPIATYSSTPNSVYLSQSLVPGVQIPDGSNKTSVVQIPSWDNYNNRITGGLNSITYLDDILDFPEIIMPTYPNPSTLPKLPQHRMAGTSFDLVSSTGIFNHSSWSSDKTYVVPSTHSAYYVPSMIIQNNERFTFDVGNNDVTFIVDRLNIHGPMQVIGNGTLTIHVTGNTPQTRANSATDKFSVSGGWSTPATFGNQASPSKVKLFIHDIYVRSGSSAVPLTMTIANNATLYLSLMASNLNISLTSSGRINGYVVSGGTTVNVSGASSAAVTLYYVPNATFNLTNSGSVNGAILANSFVSSGSVRVNYSDVAFDNFPFAVFDPVTGGDSGNVTTQFELVKGPTFEH
jgi:hypothetical protein